jgi:leader peptidase (prepilin peptidase)/N-methyltransferase
MIGSLAAAVVGAVLGVAADRLASRWPAHEEGVVVPRSVDWRTVAIGIAGAVVAAVLVTRWSDPVDLALLSVYAAVLLVLFATDLDQRLLPDVLTLPLIAFAVVVLVTGWSPLLAGKDLGLPSGIAAGIGAPALLFISDKILGGELGQGDLKLSIAIGLMSGVSLLVVGVLVASFGFSVVLVGLIAAHRLGLRSAVPFGPVLILGAFVAMALG